MEHGMERGWPKVCFGIADRADFRGFLKKESVEIRIICADPRSIYSGLGWIPGFANPLTARSATSSASGWTR
jgi:hypothetical protein